MDPLGMLRRACGDRLNSSDASVSIDRMFDAGALFSFKPYISQMSSVHTDLQTLIIFWYLYLILSLSLLFNIGLVYV
jgi:hypothetical protein